MKLSVLMSVYVADNPEHLQAAVDSIVSQTYSPDEFVIVEDGPITDEMRQVLDTLGENNTIEVRRFPLATNQGLGRALRYGLKMCRNEWVARMDSDDISLDDRFAKQVDYIETHRDIDMVGSWIDEYDDHMEHRVSIRKVPERQDAIISAMKKRSPFNHMSVMYRKSILEKVDSYEDCAYFEDYYLWCKLVLADAKFHNVQESLVKARAGLAIADRRGGLPYVKHIIAFQVKLYRIGFLTLGSALVNSVVRIVVAVAPKHLRQLFYRKALRANET